MSCGKVLTISQTYVMLWRTSSLLREMSSTLITRIARILSHEGDHDLVFHDII